MHQPHPPLILSTWSFGQRSNAAGWPALARGGSALDAVEAVARYAEADLTNVTVGVGGLPDASGRVSLDASIMISPAQRGAVANMRRFPHPISVARRVMEATPHVLLAGAEADDFAAAQGFKEQELLSKESRAAWEKWRGEHPQGPTFKSFRNVEELGMSSAGAAAGAKVHNEVHDTIGILGMDARGQIAGACSTSGMPYKLPGRVGDSPIIGQGLYVHPEIGAAVATGYGELVMGVCGAFLAVESLKRGATPLEASVEVLQRIIDSYDLSEDDQVGIIVMDRKGAWDGAALRDGFSIAVRTTERDELVTSLKVML
jgi:isoaspartyl peptidase/L-asparaginase-like protein (Ntn-hydrolase superfamily)